MDTSRISTSAVFSEPKTVQANGKRVRSFRPAYLASAILALLLISVYFPMILMTFRVIFYGDDMAHGLFAPLIVAYIVWEKRNFLLNPSGKPSPWALFFFSVAAGISTVATLANSSTFSRFALLLSLTGCLLLIGGWLSVRQFAFPLGLLLFTFPIPDVLYGEITQPLQLLATRLAESAFELLGFSVMREGNILQLVHMKLSVVEACSGLRSLITLFFFCLVYSYYFEHRFWPRIYLALASIPVAVGVNALRITMTGVLGKYNLAWTEGTYHEIVGWTTFALGFLLVFLLHRLARKLMPARTGVPA